MKDPYSTIKAGTRLTILVHGGLRINYKTGKLEPELMERSGRVVMRSSHGGWVLNMGGPHGRPGLADKTNIVAIGRRRVKPA